MPAALDLVRDGFAAVQGSRNGGTRPGGSVGGPLGASSSSSSHLQQDAEDIELPILEATTALSDGCLHRPLLPSVCMLSKLLCLGDVLEL